MDKLGSFIDPPKEERIINSQVNIILNMKMEECGDVVVHT